MSTPARSIKVWIAAHVGSDGKVRPCPDNHPRLRPILAFTCQCGGRHPVILVGNVRPLKRQGAHITIAEIQKAQARIATGGAA